MTYSSVLVTGATGVIGTATCDALSAAGFTVIPVASAQADLRNLDAATALLAEAAPDAVIHLAARVHGLMGNIRSQGEMYLDNIQINTNVVEASRLAGVKKIVAMGSVAVYPDGIPLPMREADIWTGAPHASEAGYAHAKRSMLAQLDAYNSQYGMEYAFAVSTNLFGPNDRFDEVRGHVLPSLLSKFHRGVTEGGPVTVWGTGKASRDFLYSSDAARALVTLLEAPTGSYNVASGHQVTIRQLVDEIVAATGYTGAVEWDATKPDGQAARAYDITRIASLGWAPQVPLAEALKSTFEWYSANVGATR